MANIVASLPLMLAYPLALSTVTYALGHRVARQNRQLERLNRIDVLTGLPNRRHWDEVADGELARYLRSRSEEHTSELQSLMRISHAVFCLQTHNYPLTHTLLL